MEKINRVMVDVIRLAALEALEDKRFHLNIVMENNQLHIGAVTDEGKVMYDFGVFNLYEGSRIRVERVITVRFSE